MRYYLVLASLYFVFTSLVPLIAITNYDIALISVHGLAPYYHLGVNGLLALCLFSGLFVGANLVYNVSITENEQLLALPVVLDDLVSYRLSDVLIANIKSHIFFFFPILMYLFIAMDWSVYWILLVAFLVFSLSLILYQIGILVMLFISKRLPKFSSDRIFINGVLVAMMLVVGFIRLFKSGYFGQEYASVGGMLGDILSHHSLSTWLEQMVVRPFGFPLCFITLSVSGILIYYLWKVSSRLLAVMYHNIHFASVPVTANATSITYGVTFEKLNNLFRFIPSFPRIIIVKDLLLLIRRPNLIMKVFLFTGGLVLLCNIKSSYVDNPLLLGLYLLSLLVISRLFIGAVGAEQNNILNIRLLAPSVSHYLAARIQNAILVAFIILIPLWILLVSSSGNLVLLSSFHRILFLILNVLIGSTLVIFYSASFAVFEPGNADNSYSGIHPIAMLFFWGLGLMLSIFFYKLDIVMSSNLHDSITIFVVSSIGIILLLGILICWCLGIRRINNYY